MAHKHSVYDTDLHFVIDPITRKITTECKKTQLMQKDHNSERFTFEIPRYIEGHDMSLCNVVQIHYINTNSTNKDYQVQDIYEVNDLQLSPDSEDIVIGSWLISSNATTYSGTLNFVIRFACVDEETKAIDYQWFTDIYSAITVAKTIYNVDVVTEGESSDLLEKWKEEISKAADESMLEIVQEAKKSEQAASDSASAASQSEKNAGESATNAASSAQSASDSARAAIESSNSAQQSAGTASEKAAEASESAQSASSSASSAADSATAASASAILAESYTHGRTGTREGEDTDNARYYMEQAKAVSNVDVATTDKAGIVKPDGDTITVDEDGTLHGANTYELPVATTEILGGVKPDGDTITVDEDGTLHGSSSVDEMTGATADKDGTSGTVPAPLAGQENHVLKGNGAWEALTYDSELSAESENAPKTKVVDAKTKEIEEHLSQLSNPNLLINPDFRINQRGGKIALAGSRAYYDEACTNAAAIINVPHKVTLASNGNYFHKGNDDSIDGYFKASDVVDGYCENFKYAIDRWLNFNGKIEVLNKGIKSDSNVYQFVENSDNLLGKTVTLSAKIDGVVKSGTCTLPSQYNGDTIDLVLNIEFDNANIRMFVENNNKRIQGCNTESKNGNTFVVEWVKLELGSVATPFVPPDPANELVKCQRYFQKHGCDLIPMTTREGTISFRGSLYTQMRSIPSLFVNRSDLILFQVADNTSHNVNISIKSSILSKDGVGLIWCGLDFAFTVGSGVHWQCNYDNTFYFDAEIY